MEREYEDLKVKHQRLEVENEDIIKSKILLLSNTALEIEILKRIINAVVLNLSTTTNPIKMKELITSMLSDHRSA